ncbi:MAG: macro domain-containing protein [Bacteroidales bacterium]|nr:macro domain-containing protein [Bacteroidales bacterium]
MKSIQIKKIQVELIQGDITRQADIEAIVNASNAWLRAGGGVSGAIHNAAGPELEKSGQLLAPIKPGKAVITPAHLLPNKYVIHCLGPVYGVDNPSDVLLAECFINALKICEEKNITSVAFPAISTGIFGYPKKEAAWISLQTIVDLCPSLKKVKTIRFVLFSDSDLDIFSNTLSHFEVK